LGTARRQGIGAAEQLRTNFQLLDRGTILIIIASIVRSEPQILTDTVSVTSQFATLLSSLAVAVNCG
jgi:hypothetical protein